MPSNHQPLSTEWMQAIGSEFAQPYMQDLKKFLAEEMKRKKTIFPKKEDVFRALNELPPSAVKVVILGQDPYHGVGQAHGLSFSVPAGVAIPPSLLNIYKEIRRDLGFPIPNHGCLQSWVHEGVCLLNSVLTVEKGMAASHQGKGWERFTDRVIEVLAQDPRPKVFMLWGAYAARKSEMITKAGSQHLILKAPHPSPLSAHRGFLGCGHFSKANNFLKASGQSPINWRIDPLTPAAARQKLSSKQAVQDLTL